MVSADESVGAEMENVRMKVWHLYVAGAWVGFWTGLGFGWGRFF